MEKKETNIVMHKYEVIKLLGQGTFAKVHHARDMKTGQNVAIKTINKGKLLKVGLIQQIKREISIMRLVKHPNVVHLHEVMANKSNIYFVMEYVKGGELYDKIAKGRLKEDAARQYFRQLIVAVDFCHSRGVFHRDLKLENLLLDGFGNLKVTDFGLSALIDSKRQDGLLHTTCGTPAYVAPEVISNRGYDGEKSDVWSCGVILFVLLAGFLPFRDSSLIEMYSKICKGKVKFPRWFTPDVKNLLLKILDPNPVTRITISDIMEDPWFTKGLEDNDDASPRSTLDFEFSLKKWDEDLSKPNSFNAFNLISLSPGLNLSGLFEKDENDMNVNHHHVWFTTQMPPSQVVSKLEEVAFVKRFKVMKKNGIMKLEASDRGRYGELVMNVVIFEINPSLHVVELKKTSGDTMKYLKFWDELKNTTESLRNLDRQIDETSKAYS